MEHKYTRYKGILLALPAPAPAHTNTSIIPAMDRELMAHTVIHKDIPVCWTVASMWSLLSCHSCPCPLCSCSSCLCPCYVDNDIVAITTMLLLLSCSHPHPSPPPPPCYNSIPMPYVFLISHLYLHTRRPTTTCWLLALTFVPSLFFLDYLSLSLSLSHKLPTPLFTFLTIDTFLQTFISFYSVLLM